MARDILGIHHVTAITSDAQRNLDFYSGVLGQRLVKVTVNFDDPGSYHLYYGDDTGSPGSIMTFFAWPGAPGQPRELRLGVRLVTATAYAAPVGALDFWRQRLEDSSVETQEIERFGAKTLAFEDPDGLALEIIEQEGVEARSFWSGATIPASFALRGFHSVTMTVNEKAQSGHFLRDVMNWQDVQSEGARTRFLIGDGTQQGAFVDLVLSPTMRSGMGPGVVHHVAWRVEGDEEQKVWREKVAALNPSISPVMERCYFRSIYFREPGGVLFEIATDQPGFAADEPVMELGTHLKLPPWLEASREKIEQAVPRLRLPEGSELP